MKIGIMQPYFFPYIGYWQLMNYVDKYVIYDDVNYIKGGWINRNRILLNRQPHYINIILNGAGSFKKINEITVNNKEVLVRKNLKILESAYRKAPYYKMSLPVIEDILLCGKNNLAEYLLYLHLTIAEYMKIHTKIILSSAMKKTEGLSGEKRVIDICKRLEGSQYINAIGGMQLYSREEFKKEGIELKFLEADLTPYSQYGNDFVPGLSIIDVMMFNSPEDIRAMLKNFRLV